MKTQLYGLLWVTCLAVAGFLLGLSACGGLSARTRARSAVLLASEAVSVADGVCASAGLEREDKALLEKCVTGYRAARTGLVAAAELVDTWDEARAEKDLPCVLEPTLGALTRLSEDLRAAKVDVPAEITDALEGVAKLVGTCGRKS